MSAPTIAPRFIDAGASTDLIRVMRQRASLRAFTDEDVSPALVRWIVEHARWAPSAHNSQPWRVIVTRPGPLVNALYPGNGWLGRAPYVLVIASSEKISSLANGIPYHLVDVGLFTQNVLLLATSAGLTAHPVAGFKESEVKATLEVPADHRVVLLVALGWPGDPQTLDERARQRDLRPRERRQVDDFTSWGQWGQKLQQSTEWFYEFDPSHEPGSSPEAP